MNISGILVIVSPQRVDSMVDHLNGLDGIDVHHIEAKTGRIVITQEGASVHDEVESIKRIKALPHVILAEMVHHHFEEDRETLAEIPEDLDSAEGLPEVPAFLNR